MTRPVNLDSLTSKKLQSYSENTLRTQIIIPFLYDMRASRVEDQQGSNEQGIDVYFETRDIFGHTRGFGIQIKKGDLICKHRDKPNRNIMEICLQIKSGFGKEFLLSTSSAGKFPVQIDGYYIIISGKINDPAKFHIHQQRHSYPYLHVIDGSELIQIIGRRDIIGKIPTGFPYRGENEQGRTAHRLRR